MYARAIIASAESRLAQQFAHLFPRGFTRYPAPESIARAAHLEDAYDREKKVPLRALDDDDRRFILNEQLLSQIDYGYFAARYVQVNKGGATLEPLYPLWQSQELILGEIARIEQSRRDEGHPDGILFNVLKARQLGCCLGPETRVLTPELRWKRLDDVQPGDVLVACDEMPRGGQGAARKMQTTSVEARQDLYEHAYELVLDNGVCLIATGEHRFLTRNRGGTDTKWRRVKKMVVGDVLRHITVPWGESSLEDAWFGGLLDGEGSINVKNASGAEINLSQVSGPVFDRAERYLRDRGYFARVEHDGNRPSKFGKRPVNKLCVSRMDEIFRLLGQTRPTRFIDRRWWEGKELPGKRVGGGWAKLLEIRPLGVRRVIDLQTTEKTFIAEGVVSHNSTLVQSLIAHRVVTQRNIRAMIGSDTPDNTGSDGLFGMLELVVEHLPWWLVPPVKFHTKDRHIHFDNGSRVRTESGKSMKGGLTEKGGSKGQMGRSKTYSVVHLSELSTWEHAEQIDDSLMPAIPRQPRTLMGLESTAKGRANWWHRHWEASVRGRTRHVPIFIPWYAEPQKYWLPAPTSWVPAVDTLHFATRATLEGPKYLHASVHLTREQLYWYEQTKLEFIEKGALYKFLEEYCATPEEAFQYSGRSIFPLAVQERIKQQARPLLGVLEVKARAELAQMQAQEQAELAGAVVAASGVSGG